MKNFSVRTDLALEACQINNNLNYNFNSSTDGIEIKTQDFQNNIHVTSVNIKNKTGEEKLLKPMGIYITIECQNLRENNFKLKEQITKILSCNINKFLFNKKYKNILVVGLGNKNITADALGSKTISKILVTRHIKNFIFDQELDKNNKKNKKDKLKNISSVSAISPGVLGVTGLETLEVIKGICNMTKPDLVFIIDSLAARSSSRINSTIQLSNTGITPGAGMGNKQAKLDKENLGCEIISIGVPTVIDAATLVNDTIEKILDLISLSYKDYKKSYKKDFINKFFGSLENLNTQQKYEIIKNILEPYKENMFVTPKEVDEIIERLSDIISSAINISLHDKIILKDINSFIYK